MASSQELRAPCPSVEAGVTANSPSRPPVAGKHPSGPAAIPSVVSAERLFGDPHHLLRIVTADLAAYHSLQDEQLGTLPGVQCMNSTLVMERVMADHSISP
ncbi:Lrp/AsnC ligand binding domain-containing protein [Geodermatophilus sp. SYSU D00703]